MEISFDPAKREWTLEHRGLDFRDAAALFAGRAVTLEDDRWDYGEPRYQTFGLLRGRLVVLIWTPRGAARHVISMRKANERERKRYDARME
ncbi:MAG: BrnT family toxin [Alphaproteobacteria bacterium]|nr:BrnT family toxin [Alphaproteobacteria bacterium]MBV9373003.1 BrnT family toxin [Alphaproteobacteria bacterium]MBV9901370.1 BrnT family toxin [Alphaproteobacteria bacterium]